MKPEIHKPCPKCGETMWSFNGTIDIPLIEELSEDLIRKYHRGVIKKEFENLHEVIMKASAFSCKSCGYTLMKDERENYYELKNTNIEK